MGRREQDDSFHLMGTSSPAEDTEPGAQRFVSSEMTSDTIGKDHRGFVAMT